MSLEPGTRLGPYEIVCAIGAGGMGEVYRATDTNLKRVVAIKVLPDPFAADPDRLARFQREAELLGALNSHHIAQIYGLQKTGDSVALVLELVDGETLADRIARGPVPLEEALPIASQIADALDAAHQRGIIHRDLKPANIKVRSDGTVKVLDFGLAKLTETTTDSTAMSGHLSFSPTITTPAQMTGVGALLGTAAYMSPEQARGATADRRTDLWSFGCVLFEMLTGTRLFDGGTVSDALAAVLKTEPQWAALPANTPAPIRRLLRRCLEKDRARRLESAADARLEIEEAGKPSEESSRLPSSAPRAALWRRMLPWALTALFAAVLLAVVVSWAPWRSSPPITPVRLNADLGADASLVTEQGPAAILSPDGEILVFAATPNGSADSQIFVRRLRELEASPLAGTQGARNPFFSPDGQWIAFFAGGKLKKVATTGGAVVTLCNAENGRGGDWGEDGTIIFTPNNTLTITLLRVSAAGGTPEPASMLGLNETTHRWPQIVGGGRAIVYSAARTLTEWDEGWIVVQPLPAGTPKVVQRNGYFGRYLPSGHLAFVRDGTLFAEPFDLDRMEVTGKAVPILESVTASPNATGGAQVAFSRGGAMVYVPAVRQSLDAPLVWMTRDGKTTPLRTATANWANPSFSPDGRTLAMYIVDGRRSDVWTYEPGRDTLSRFTFNDARDVIPIWTADGRRITFASNRADQNAFNIYWQRGDGTGEPQRLTDSKNSQTPTSWHPSGKFLAFFEEVPEKRFDLMILPIEGDDAAGWKPGKPTVFLSTPFNEQFPVFSPDGRWLAYSSNESGRNEVYVRPFPGPGGKWQVSADGGGLPRWSRTRHELLFEGPDDRLMVASYSVQADAFVPDKPRVWSMRRFGGRDLGWDFDLHPDGERVAVAPVPDSVTTIKRDKLVFLFDFLDDVRRASSTSK
jgi:serine/threonine protein kinase/Tol biopolymer transport system component